MHRGFGGVDITFFDICKYSQENNKECVFAMKNGDDVKCSAIMGWWHDLSIKNINRCFITQLGRDKLAWRNRMIKQKKISRVENITGRGLVEKFGS